MNVLTTPLARRLCQVGIGLIFVGSALAKIGDVGLFAEQLHNYRLVPLWSEHLLAMVIPWIELLTGLSLVLAIRPRSGAWLATGLLVAFTAAVGAAMARGLDFECGCFGSADATRIGVVKFAENTGMLVIAAIGSLRSR
jgi:hypothetical protein